MKKYYDAFGIIGLIIAFYGVISAILYSNVTWFSYFVIGGTFFLGWINYKLKNKSIFGKNKIYLLKTYGIYLVFAVIIELVGRFLLHLWTYPLLNVTKQIIHVFLIGYPFVFFFIYESFKLIQKKVHSLLPAIILTTLVNVFIHEIPNTFAWEWAYTIPYVTFEILQINIIVIFGWAILIAIPLIVNKIIK